jgi:hypothetical protein
MNIHIAALLRYAAMTDCLGKLHPVSASLARCNNNQRRNG